MSNFFTHYRVNMDHQIPEMIPATNAGPVDYLEDLNKNLKIEITNLNEECIEFDLVGVDVSIANALRRILLSEVPTVAIEHVWIAINSSIIQDEVLAHRVGLIPIKVDPKKLDYVVGEDETDRDTIVFHFDVECKNEKVTKPNGQEEYVNESALSGQLTWLPQGSQNEIFPEGVKPVHDDIVVAKLRPGQRIEFEAHCRKGVGKDHTKYSPVATATYRLLPDIILTRPIKNEEAYELQNKCPMQVFDIEDLGKGEVQAKVARPRDCTMCRECIRLDDWSEKVQLKRKADHFLFSVETVGSLAPEVIVREGISILKEKALKFQTLIEEHESSL